MPKRNGEHDSPLELLARLVPLLAIALPAAGFVVRYVGFTVGTPFADTNLALAESIPSLAFVGLAAAAPGTIVFALASNPERARSRRAKGRRLARAVALLALLALAILAPGGWIYVSLGLVSGFISKRTVRRFLMEDDEEGVSYTRLIPVAILIAGLGAVGFGLAPSPLTAGVFEFAEGSGATNGEYVAVGTSSAGEFLVPCSDPSGYVVVPSRAVQLIRFEGAHTPHPASLWQMLIGDRSFDLGYVMSCTRGRLLS